MTRSVRIGLQPTDAPQPGVAERAIIEVHWILGRDDHADAEGSRLLHQGNQWTLGRMRRETQTLVVFDEVYGFR